MNKKQIEYFIDKKQDEELVNFKMPVALHARLKKKLKEKTGYMVRLL